MVDVRLKTKQQQHHHHLQYDQQKHHSVVVNIIYNNGAHRKSHNILLKAKGPRFRVARPAGTVYDDADADVSPPPSHDPRSRCVSPIAPASSKRSKHITINPDQYYKQT